MYIDIDYINSNIKTIEDDLRKARSNRIERLIEVLPIKEGDYIKFMFYELNEETNYLYVKKIEKQPDYISLNGPIVSIRHIKDNDDFVLMIERKGKFVIQAENIDRRLKMCEKISKKCFVDVFFKTIENLKNLEEIKEML